MSECLPIKENISVYEGDDCKMQFTSNLGDITGYSVKLQARIDTSSRYAILDVDGVIKDGSNGVYEVEFQSAETLGKAQDKAYFYDIKLTDPNGGIHTDRSGMLTVEPRTTDLLSTKTVAIYGVDVEKDGQTIKDASRDINFVGNGVRVSSTGTGVNVEIEKTATAPTLALHFSGIYDDLQSLKDAIPKPTENMQAIVIQPSEKYYHAVGGSWVELAPVGVFHSKYLGAYDSVADLKLAEPSPQDDSLAIVGTDAKSFYVYEAGDWAQVGHTDLPTLATGVADNKQRIGVAEGHIQTLQTATGKNTNDIAAIYAPDKATFDSKVDAHLAQPKSDISALQAKTQQLSAADGVLQSNIDQKISGIHVEDADNNAFDDISALHFVGAEVSVQNGNANIDVKPKITVANGQEPGSTSVTGNAIVFKGETVSVDPNDTNVIIVGRTDAPSFDPAMFQSAVDHGYATDDQGIKSTQTTNGWWIFKDLKQVSGRPADAIGDLIVFKNELPEQNIALKHVFVMAIGKNKQLQNKVWFMYRDGTAWTPWFSEIGANQSKIDTLSNSVDELKKGNQAALNEIDSLRTAIGSIYIPGDKDAFNKAVNALIDEKLKNYIPSSSSHGSDGKDVVYPRFYAGYGTTYPTDFTNYATSTTAEATLQRSDTGRSRVFIAVENGNNEASKVKGIKINDGLAMSWKFADITIQGSPYRVFYSSGAFTETSLEIKVDFGQGV